jgi:hypothetical protein
MKVALMRRKTRFGWNFSTRRHRSNSINAHDSVYQRSRDWNRINRFNDGNAGRLDNNPWSAMDENMFGVMILLSAEHILANDCHEKQLRHSFHVLTHMLMRLKRVWVVLNIPTDR